jgi:tight adherence protein B
MLRITRGALALVAGTAALSAGLFAPIGAGLVASAETTVTAPDAVVIREVNAVDRSKVSVVVQTTKDAGDTFNITVDGTQPRGLDLLSLSEAGVTPGIVYVVDGSKNAASEGRLPRILEAVASAIRSKPANQEVAIISFSVTPRLISGFTADSASLINDVMSIQAGDRSETAVVDALVKARDLLRDRSDLQKNIILVTASGELSSSASRSAFRGDLIDQAITMSTVSLASEGIDHSITQALAIDSKGLAQIVTTTGELPGAVAAAADLISRQQVARFSAEPDAAELDILASVTPKSGSANTAAATVVVGNRVKGRSVQPPGLRQPSAAPGLLGSSNGKYIALGLTCLATVLAGIGVVSLFIRDRTNIDKALRHYSEGGVVDSDGSVADTAFVKKASDALARMAERRGMLGKLEVALERADLPLRPGEAMFFYLAITAVIAAMGFVLSGKPLIILGVLVLGAVMPAQILNFLVKRRRNKFQAQLPDVLQILASTLKAGYSLPQGVEAVSHEVPEPAAKELTRVMIEARLGRPLEEALQEAADRLNSEDFAWVVMAIGIQREVGGNLAELLLSVADTMTQRERLRRDIKSLTAEGRMSAYVLGLLPPGLGVAIYMLNPSYISLLWTDKLGKVLLGIACVLMVGGFVWMRKMIEVDI